MATKTYLIEKPRSLYDVCIDVYGNTQYKYKLASDNNLNVDFDLIANYWAAAPERITSLIYDDTVGDFSLRDKIKNNNIEINNT